MPKQIYITEDQLDILKDKFAIGDDGDGALGYVHLDENIQYEIEPHEIDLSSFRVKKELHPDFWKDGLLDSKVRMKLLDIADDFCENLKFKWVKPYDIVLTGSICGLNWSNLSDVDMHIILNFSDIDENTELVREYVNMKKNEWNNDHEALLIHDLPVEIYVEDLADDTVSDGIYSLEQNKWLKQPKNGQELHISARGSKIRRVAADLLSKIDDYEQAFHSIEDMYKLECLSKKVDKLLKNISQIRKDGLNSDLKEKSLGNILYKIVRRTHYLDKIWDLKLKIYDKLNSI